MSNLYKVRKNTIRQEGTGYFIEEYYTLVRLERYFFNLIGPRVWKEYHKWRHCWDSSLSHYELYKTSCYQLAVEECKELNKKTAKKYNDHKIVYEEDGGLR